MSKLRKQIAEILVKWSMSTRQVAISEIEALFTEEWERMVKEGKPEEKPNRDNTTGYAGYLSGKDDGFNEAIDQYESNLTQKLAKLMEEGE